MFTQNFLDKIKRCGLRKIVEQYTELTKINSNTWRGKCPHPDHDDSTPSFDITLDKDGIEKWRCWGCHSGKKDAVTNFGCDNIAFVQWMSSSSKSKKFLSFIEAVTFLAEYYGVELEYDPNSKKYEDTMKLAKVYHDSMPSEVSEYLESRGLDQEDIDKWLIGYRPIGIAPGRITFPITDKYGNILGFSAREFSTESKKEQRKYVNSQGLEKKRILYGIQHYNFNRDTIIITEGPMDVILAHKYGLDNVVSTLGCSLSDEQIEIIKSMNKRPILCYDSDQAGMAGIQKALHDFHQVGISGAKILVLPEGKDLADTALDLKEDLLDYVKEHVTTHAQYILDNLASQFDRKMLEVQNEMMPKIQEALSLIQDQNEKLIAENYIHRRLRLWAA